MSETFDIEGDNGKEQLMVQMREDGKVEVMEVDGKVENVGDSVIVVDPKDPEVIAAAEYACEQRHLVFVRVIFGTKQHTFKGTLYRLVIHAKHPDRDDIVIFVASVLKTKKEIVVLHFKLV